ncbi:MAG: hypothetical protein Q8K33_01420 [Cypionkella sp.]|uniref:hypothetical protein n=1 Tax=Cypionkella sp. TaxID=2811411 RepID=UPI0027303DB0|nr:hypothetical protein [Cypionkella sp.]MDP2047540.1 hypothetical protein [Cypionkella sp.]
MIAPHEIISDEEIIRVHGHANFGDMSPREVVNDGVRKYAIGYTGGHTQLCILIEHGLITKPKPGKYSSNLTQKGKRYARAVSAAQHDALSAHAAAEVAKARLTFPDDVLALARRVGRGEWGQTDPKTAAEHAADMALTVEKTAAHFGQTEPQPMNGVYIDGTGIVICHTGTSPNSPEIARALTGLWNMIYDAAQIGAKP